MKTYSAKAGEVQHGWYVVDEEAGRLVGYAGLRAVAGARDADIQTITIAEASRGRGRGRAMLRALLEEAVRRGVADVFLEVRSDNPVAQALFNRQGCAAQLCYVDDIESWSTNEITINWNAALVQYAAWLADHSTPAGA